MNPQKFYNPRIDDLITCRDIFCAQGKYVVIYDMI